MIHEKCFDWALIWLKLQPQLLLKCGEDGRKSIPVGSARRIWRPLQVKIIRARQACFIDNCALDNFFQKIGQSLDRSVGCAELRLPDLHMWFDTVTNAFAESRSASGYHEIVNRQVLRDRVQLQVKSIFQHRGHQGSPLFTADAIQYLRIGICHLGGNIVACFLSPTGQPEDQYLTHPVDARNQ